AINALPDLAGFGGVRSLHQAMAMDTTGRLQALVNNFAAQTNPDLRAQVMTTLLYAWAGVENIDPASRAATQIYGNAIGDARKLATLETFLGEGYMGIWCWGALDPNPHGRAAPTLIEAFDGLVASYSAQLMAQTQFKSLYEAIGLRWDAAAGALQFDVSQVINILRTKYSADAAGTLKLMTEFGAGLSEMGDGGVKVLEILRASGAPGAAPGFEFNLSQLGWLPALGSELANTLYGREDRSNSLYGFGGDDRLYGGGVSDLLEGDSGADWLYGQAGDDVLKGGAGNDQLIGGTGNDTYWVLAGEGRDTINETSVDARDVLCLGAGLYSAQTQVVREAMDLVLVFNAADSVRIVGYFSQAAVETIQFADGTVWDMVAVTSRITYNGTAGNDYLTALAGVANRINGLAGNDQIIGADKDDVL
ncbi:MAG: calcium-binding protein, partial [Alcaligenaceae bacterium]